MRRQDDYHPRGKEHNAHYLAVKDDGDGVPRDADGNGAGHHGRSTHHGY